MLLEKLKQFGGLLVVITLITASPYLYAQSVGDQFDIAGSSISLNEFSQTAEGFFDIVETGGRGAATARNTTEELNLVSFGFGDIGNDFETVADAGLAEEISDDADVAPAVEGKALFYPSPFSIRSGGTLGYKLSKRMEIEIHMYDMMANLVYRNVFARGADGGKLVNKIRFSSEDFDGFELSTGVYFYLIIHDGQVLAKGKVGVVP